MKFIWIEMSKNYLKSWIQILKSFDKIKLFKKIFILKIWFLSIVPKKIYDDLWIITFIHCVDATLWRIEDGMSNGMWFFYWALSSPNSEFELELKQLINIQFICILHWNPKHQKLLTIVVFLTKIVFKILKKTY